MAPFCGWGSTVSRLQSHYQETVSDLRSSWYSFHRPRNDERLSQPRSHPVVLKTEPLDWESSALKACRAKTKLRLYG